MLNSRIRTGKELHDFTLSELIEEYKKTNAEGGKIVSNAIELNVLEIKRDEINSKLKAYNEYTADVAREFIRRFT